MVRRGENGELMAVVQAKTDQAVSSERLQLLQDQLKAFLLDRAAAGGYQLASLYFQEYNDVSNQGNSLIPKIDHSPCYGC